MTDEILEKNRAIVKMFDEHQFDKEEFLPDANRPKIYNLREEIAVEGFKARDYIDFMNKGRQKDRPDIISAEARHSDDHSLVRINYQYNGGSNKYNPDNDAFTDLYEVDRYHRVTCLAGYEGEGAIGQIDIFTDKCKDITDAGVTMMKQFYEKYDKEFNYAMQPPVPKQASAYDRLRGAKIKADDDQRSDGSEGPETPGE